MQEQRLPPKGRAVLPKNTELWPSLWRHYLRKSSSCAYYYFVISCANAFVFKEVLTMSPLQSGHRCRLGSVYFNNGFVDTDLIVQDDYCNICWVEGVGAAPAIRLRCGHIFHHSCVVNKLSNGWTGSCIAFSFLDCPLCKHQIVHSSLKCYLQPLLTLQKRIKRAAVQVILSFVMLL
jgi:hypothetical protein